MAQKRSASYQLQRAGSPLILLNACWPCSQEPVGFDCLSCAFAPHGAGAMLTSGEAGASDAGSLSPWGGSMPRVCA